MANKHLNAIVGRAIDKILEEAKFEYEPSEILEALFESEVKKTSFKKRKTEKSDIKNLRLFSENTYLNYIKKDDV
jgi:hypothetical protein